MIDPEHTSNHIPPLTEITSAYQDVLEFNRRRSHSGHAFATVMDALLAADEAGQSDDLSNGKAFEEHIRDRATEDEMEGALQDVIHGETLSRIGIKLMPQSVETFTSRTQQQLTSNKLVPFAGNTELYHGFLEGLDTDTVLAAESNYHLMQDVLTNLNWQVNTAFGRETAAQDDELREQLEEVGTDALRTFSVIQPEYERLGLDTANSFQDYKTRQTPYEHLQECEKYWGQNVLPEYLEAGDELGIGTQEHYFDGGHDKLVSRVDYILSLMLDERTKNFGEEIAKAKTESLALTAQVIEDDPEAWFASADNKRLVTEQRTRLASVIEAS